MRFVCVIGIIVGFLGCDIAPSDAQEDAEEAASVLERYSLPSGTIYSSPQREQSWSRFSDFLWVDNTALLLSIVSALLMFLHAGISTAVRFFTGDVAVGYPTFSPAARLLSTCCSSSVRVLLQCIFSHRVLCSCAQQERSVFCRTSERHR